MPLRRRFTFRGDSLWWFAELYLHKEQAILALFEIVAALRRADRAGSGRAGSTSRAAAPFVALRRRPDGEAARTGPRPGRRFRRWSGAAVSLRLDARGALAARRRARLALACRAPVTAVDTPAVAAFVHRAFWRSDGDDGSAESYIGPVLAALERRLPPGEVRYVGVGPRTNFRARRWWHAFAQRRRAVRHRARSRRSRRCRRFASRARCGARGTRCAARSGPAPTFAQHAVIRGCDCWPIVREELAGIALLQWPWSARAMDEAAAALDALQPRRRGDLRRSRRLGPRARCSNAAGASIPLAGLQHGFIYRHWLNYLHEPDEMEPDPATPTDAGFPRPALTLLFDDYAARHLDDAPARFPPGRLAVTGSPRLDELVATARGAHADTAAEAARRGDARPTRRSSCRDEVHAKRRAALPALARRGPRACRTSSSPSRPIRPKRRTSTTRWPQGEPNVRVLARVGAAGAAAAGEPRVVTVNSTVALDAAVLGVPALVIGLPNNLSPFVEAGAMAGAPAAQEIGRRSGKSCMIRSSASSSNARERLLLARFRHRLRRRRRRALRRGHARPEAEIGGVETNTCVC